ncbi:hypothetical protein GCM10011511_41900 [Puia dinghuensis]|uniref:Uncharacterized protein n=1 Tax=Puia dinghuensis TaxID=1792502 RepID=A0A8J2XUP3_9BACT|nr:hypothetical protein GCM10011511_41900 [Puia dinghuensis]
MAHSLLFIVVYLSTTVLLVPLLARPFGRVPLVISRQHHLGPQNVLTCLLNRNYVRPRLKEIAEQTAIEMNREFPGTEINYLDASFPFIDKFPLFPHLSHNDGKKLDLSFCYLDSKTGLSTNNTPSFCGYGICEEPRPGERDQPCLCGQQGYWEYSLMRRIVPQHLKARLGLNYDKIRYHGCHAVRHDDHIHVQLQ